MNALSQLLSSRQDDFFNGAAAPSPIARYPLQIQSSTTDQLKQMIFTMKDQLDSMLRVLDNPSPINGGEGGVTALANIETHALPRRQAGSLPVPWGGHLETGEQIIEGVFNGQKMVGPDGQEYLVPPNYASKSKMVEGDLLKLTITNRGQFIYKQIGPVERERRRGELVSDPDTDQCSVLSDDKTYRILKASVTFYKGQAGDEVIFLVPKDANGSAQWGAVENIIHSST